MVRRIRDSSSVSSSGRSSGEGKRNDSRPNSASQLTSATLLPEVGAIVRGTVSTLTRFGAFVKVPGFADGLIHVTRMLPSKDAFAILKSVADIRKTVQEDAPVVAKVLSVGPGEKYALDIRFVDQETGKDEDPENEKRNVLEAALTVTEDRYGDAQKNLPALNAILPAVVKSHTMFGSFVSVGSEFKDGLLPKKKVSLNQAEVDNFDRLLEVGQKVWVKVVEVQADRGKYNVDRRYVDQSTGEDLDPSHQHSSERIFATQRGEGRREDDGYRRREGRREDNGPHIPNYRDDKNFRSQSRSRSPVVRRRTDRDHRSDEDLPRRRTGRSEDDEKIPRRRTERSRYDEEIPRRGRTDDDEIPRRRNERDDNIPRRGRTDDAEVPRRRNERDDEIPRRGRTDDAEVPRRRTEKSRDDEIPRQRTSRRDNDYSSRR